MKFIYSLLLLSFSTLLLAQKEAVEASKAENPTIQPTIMVIPFARENQDMRNVLERNVHLRVATTKVKEGFDSRGFTTVDFRAKLKQLNNEKAMEIENQSSLKQEVIELSGADIYIETESSVNYSNSGNSVTVIVTAYDAFSGQSLSNKVGTSPKFYTKDFNKLTEKAVDGIIEDFLNVMQEKFNDIVENGRTVSINIGFSENSDYDMDSEFGEDEDLFSDVLEDWFGENAYKGYYHVQGVTATKMILDDVRIPLRDLKGRNYRASKFAAKIRKYLKSLELDCTRDVQGTKIFITIN